MTPVTKQKCIYPNGLSRLLCLLLPIFFLTTFFTPVVAQDRDTCDTEKEAVRKARLAMDAESNAKKLAADFNNLPPATKKPDANKDASAAKTALDASRIKWDKTKDALTDAKKNLKPGSDEISMKQDIANKQKELTNKKDELKNKDIKTYNENRSKIAQLRGELSGTIKNFKRSAAGEILSNTDYKNIDFSKNAIANCTGTKAKQLNVSEDMLRGECYLERAKELLDKNRFIGERISELTGELQNAVTAISAVSKVSSTSKESPNETISRAGPLLQMEIEKTQTAIKDKYAEYVKLDNGIGILQEQINALTTDLKTLEDQLKPITEAQKKTTDAKKEFDDAEKKWKETEKNAQDLKDWEAADTKRKNAKQKMDDAAAEKTKADTEKANAENADAVFKAPAAAPLNAARTAAALDLVIPRMAVRNRPLFREAAREAVENNAKVAENKLKLEKAITKPGITEAQKIEINRRWVNYLTPIVMPHYVRKRNEAEAERLRGIKDDAALQSFKCVKEVHEFIILVNQKINEVLALKVSLASDSDFDDPNDEKIIIPDDWFPPLDEGEGTDTPTDEVPDDLVKNTSEVKVFNVRPGAWLSTGIQLKKGQQYSITAKGTVTREKDRTWGPDGYYLVGYMAHSLKALIGDKLVEIGSSHSGTAPVDGELKLGITWTYEGINPADSKHKGSFVATVIIDGK